jgi:hypothetical protein
VRMDEKCASLPAQLLGRCIRVLANYAPRRRNVQYPRERCAAVLVALFVGRKGDLYVLLSRYVTRRTKPPSGDNPLLGEHLPYGPTRVILPYQVEEWMKRTGMRKRQR